MSRTTWSVEKKSGGSWVSDGTIYTPNVDLSYGITSTQKKIALANGDFGYVLPSTKYNKDVLSFGWLEVSNSFVNKIETYAKEATDLKITDGISGKIYYGRFIRTERREIVGIENAYDLVASFELMDSLA